MDSGYKRVRMQSLKGFHTYSWDASGRFAPILSLYTHQLFTSLFIDDVKYETTDFTIRDFQFVSGFDIKRTF